METRNKGNRDTWLPIEMCNEISEVGRGSYDYGRTVGHNHGVEATLPTKIMSRRSAQGPRNWSGGGGLQVIIRSSCDNGRGRRLVRRYYTKVAEGNRKGIPSEMKVE